MLINKSHVTSGGGPTRRIVHSLYQITHEFRLYHDTLGRLRGRMLIFFFFSSRRRHTRFKCDWSSDVCSSDLAAWGRRVFKVQRSRFKVEKPAFSNLTLNFEP